MRSEKDSSDDQVRGLKYELTGLQSNFEELQETSSKSLEELERVCHFQGISECKGTLRMYINWKTFRVRTGLGNQGEKVFHHSQGKSENFFQKVQKKLI